MEAVVLRPSTRLIALVEWTMATSSESPEAPLVGASVVFTVYCHTHVATGRRYVGVTKKTMLQRWNQHVYQAGCTGKKTVLSRSHFCNAIQRYGKDAFSHEVLEVCTSLEVANLAEQCWIEFFDTRNPLRGFNFKRGGDHQPHPKRNPWDRPEFREKQLVAQKKRWEDPLEHLRASKASKEVLSRPEVIQKISEATSRQFASEESRQVQSELLKKLHADPETAERFARGLETANANRAAKTHCKNGHEFTPENTKVYGPGWRKCRRCAADQMARKSRAKTREACKNGHPWVEGGFKESASGSRLCFACRPTACKKGHDQNLPGARWTTTPGCRICKLAIGRRSDARRRAKKKVASSEWDRTP